MIDSDDLKQLAADFLEEALPRAEDLVESLLEIERRWQAREAADDLLAHAKRQLHTLKGNAGMMQVVPIESLAHRLEDLCALLVERPALRGPEAADLLIRGARRIGGLVREFAAGALDTATPDGSLPEIERWAAEVRGEPRPSAGDESSRTAGGEPGRAAAVGAPPELASAGDTVRVDFHRLDMLLELVGEALISESEIVESHRRLHAGLPSSPALLEVDRATKSLGKVLKRLQQELVATRLLPVSTVFRKFAATVRDLAKEHGKLVRLSMSGADTTIDKAIIDRLGEPILHLVRNAIAHGIEPPDERARVGKPREGSILLSAAHGSGRVAITVEDDGRGLDQARILERARALGYEVGPASSESLTALVFLPGFSTAESASTLSGRGVGLDAVARSIQAMDGTIAVHTESGRGTAFRLDLPLTLAIMRALFVEVDGETYALPVSYVSEILRVDGKALRRVAGQPVLAWRDSALRIVDAGQALGTRPDAPGERRRCVVLSHRGARRGLFVDRILGSREIVVKGVEEMVGKQRLVSGVTITGEGKVIFILDPRPLAGESAVEASSRAGLHQAGAVA